MKTDLLLRNIQKTSIIPRSIFQLIGLLVLCGLQSVNSEEGFKGVQSAEVRAIQGTPVLHINGNPYNPLIYFGGPHRTPSKKDGGFANPMTAAEWKKTRAKALHTVELAAQSGVHLHSFDVWLPWAKPGQKADYQDVDEAIQYVIEADSEGMFLLRFTMDPPAWWREAHPEELMKWEGDKGMEGQVPPSEYAPGTVVSVASDVWRKDACEQLANFVKHIETGKYAKHVFGYHFCGQNSHEWFTIGGRRDRLANCESVFTAAWRRWLKEKYPSEKLLQEAWGDTQATCSTAKAPIYGERLSATNGYFRDPSKEQRIIDFNEYQSVSVVEALEQFAHVIKQESRKLAVCFYGYHFEHGTYRRGPQQSGHLALNRLLKCPDIDAICSPISYNQGARVNYNSRMLGGTAAFMTTVDSVALHGKLWYNEDDTRTHIGLGNNQAPLNTLEETINVHKRNFSHLFVRGMSCWWMDLGGLGWLDQKEIWDNLGELSKYYREHFASGIQFDPEIAVIADERSLYAVTQGPQPLTFRLLFMIRESLYRIGAPCGYYQLEDLVSGRISPKKMYVFLDCFQLTDADREAIAKQCAGKTCVFMYANGLINRTIDVRNMESVLGTSVRMISLKTEGVCEPESTKIMQGVEDFGQGNLSFAVTLAQSSSGANSVELLGKYKNTPEAAAWVHQDGYRSIYLGILDVPPMLFRNIAKSSGVHVYVDQDDVIEANTHFFSIHANTDGKKEIRLPRSCTVTEALTGKQVGKDIEHLIVEMKKGDTCLYTLSP